MKKNRIHYVIILGSISLIGIIIFQVFWIYNTFSSDEKQLDLSIKNALFNVAHEMAEFNHSQAPNINPVNQISPNNFVVNIDDIIDPIILEHFLETEFENSQIHIDYEYAIYDCESDAMVHVKRINVSGKKHKKLEEGDFKKFDDYNYYFAIRFPNKTASVLYDMNVWAISAFVLIMAFLFFIYAIFIIMRQKKLSDVQKDFINNMTHEFKTPISTISIACQALTDKDIMKSSSIYDTYLNIISEENNRLSGMAERILQSARLQKGEVVLKAEEINLHDVITDAIQKVSLQVEKKGGKITLEALAENPVIFADRVHITNIIFNLLDNANKYTPWAPIILIKTKNISDGIVISIKDNGVGISKSNQKKVFEKLFRVPTGNVHNVKGFGLGLSYVKTVVEKHLGKITLDSELKKGSTFSVYLPLK